MCFNIVIGRLFAHSLQAALENVNSKIISNLVNKVLNHDVHSFG